MAKQKNLRPRPELVDVNQDLVRCPACKKTMTRVMFMETHEMDNQGRIACDVKNLSAELSKPLGATPYDYSRDLVISLSGVFYERATMREVDPQEICECGHLHVNPYAPGRPRSNAPCANYLEDASGWCPCERFEKQVKGWHEGIETRPRLWPVARVRWSVCPSCMERIPESLYDRHRLECSGVVVRRNMPWSNKPGVMEPLSLEKLKEAIKGMQVGEQRFFMTPLDREGRPLPPELSGTQVVSSTSLAGGRITGRFLQPGDPFYFDGDWGAPGPDEVFIIKQPETPEKPKPAPFVERPRGRRIGPEE